MSEEANIIGCITELARIGDKLFAQSCRISSEREREGSHEVVKI